MQTVPTFPNFRHLALADKDWYEEVYAKYPKYADFSFGNLMIWRGTDDDLRISQLNGNIVILDKPHYMNGEVALNFMGNHEVNKTIKELLGFLQENNFNQVLLGVPEYVVNSIHDKDLYEITEDPDNNEYILDVERLATLEGSIMQSPRYFISKFKKAAGSDYYAVSADVNDEQNKQSLLAALEKWDKVFNTNDSADQEKLVMERMFKLAYRLDYKSINLYVKNEMVGFIIYRKIDSNTATYNHQKTNYSYPNLSFALVHESAKILHNQGFTHINYEQDLGIEGLRKFKQNLKPVHILKKYTIRPRQ